MSSPSVVYFDESAVVSLVSSAAELRDVLYTTYWRLEQRAGSAEAPAHASTVEGPALSLSEAVTASCGLGHLPTHYRDDEVAGAVTRTRRRRDDGEGDSDVVDGVCVLCSAGTGHLLAVALLPPLRLLCEAACLDGFLGRVAAAATVAFSGFTTEEAIRLCSAADSVEETSVTTADVVVCRGVGSFRRALTATAATLARPSWLVFLTADADGDETLPLPSSAAVVVCDPLVAAQRVPSGVPLADASGLFSAAPPGRLPLPAVAALWPDSPLVCLAACKYVYEKYLSTKPRD